MIIKFLQKVAYFLLPVIILYGILIAVAPYLLSQVEGPSTKNQILTSFDNALKGNYELLILGNSRIYRGMNPDFFSIPAYNLSHDNDTYNQLFYKLEYLLNNGKKIKYLILGVDYFQFSFISDTRNYAYGEILGKDYLNDYPDKDYKLKNTLNNLMPEKNRYVIKALFRIITGRNNDKIFLRNNGQFIVHQPYTGSLFIKRDYKRIKIQENYFNKILAKCVENNIIVFLVMPPLRKEEMSQYPHQVVRDFNDYIKKSLCKKCFYLNYAASNKFSGKNFIDATHLSEKSANKFSAVVNRDILNLIEDDK